MADEPTLGMTETDVFASREARAHSSKSADQAWRDAPLEGVDVMVVGGGPAGLAAAEAAAEAGRRVVVFEKMPSLGRKLLMAGKSGLNLTNAAPLEAALGAYSDGGPALEAAIRAFPPAAVRAWAERLGQPTFVGSGGRVFPRTMKASPLLRAWLERLSALGVVARTRHVWRGLGADGAHRFETPQGPRRVAAKTTVLALGGASWSRLGSDGGWVAALAELGARVRPFTPSNVGWRLVGDVSRWAGAPLKPIALQVGGRRFAGEMVLTRDGLEGGALYAAHRALVASDGVADVDLAPGRAQHAIAAALARARTSDSLSNRLRKAARLTRAKIALLRAVVRPPDDPARLAALIKSCPLQFAGPKSLDEAISTAGGVDWASLDGYRISARGDVFVAGEMIAWDAPTGGWLLSAAIATGRAAGDAAARSVAAGGHAARL